jgi:hypothetical protein
MEMLQVEIAIALIGAALFLGFILGYGLRAFISARRRRRSRYRRAQLPLHSAPLLAPESADVAQNQAKRVGNVHDV